MSTHTHAPTTDEEADELFELPEPEEITDVRHLRAGDRVRLNGTGKLRRVEFVGAKAKDTLPSESPRIIQYGVEVEGGWSDSVPTAIVHEYSAWTGHETGRLVEREMGYETKIELVEMKL